MSVSPSAFIWCTNTHNYYIFLRVFLLWNLKELLLVLFKTFILFYFFGLNFISYSIKILTSAFFLIWNYFICFCLFFNFHFILGVPLVYNIRVEFCFVIQPLIEWSLSYLLLYYVCPGILFYYFVMPFPLASPFKKMCVGCFHLTLYSLFTLFWGCSVYHI